MKYPILAALAVSLLAPMAATSMPVVGDVVGSGADVVKVALEAAGCVVSAFEAEDGKVEAICAETATGKVWDITIDPASGAITSISGSDD